MSELVDFAGLADVHDLGDAIDRLGIVAADADAHETTDNGLAEEGRVDPFFQLVSRQADARQLLLGRHKDWLARFARAALFLTG